MPRVSETIPEALGPQVEAALEWFNRDQAIPYEVTGILDPEDALAQPGPRELRLVLCGGDRCEQRSFRVTAAAHGYDVAFLDASANAATDETAPPPELDPPPGARRGWLDRTLDQHAFSVILFYRGFW